MEIVEVDEQREVLLLAPFLVDHDRLEERVTLVEWQEPVCYAVQVFAGMQQAHLGEVGVESAFEPFLQVACLQLDVGLDAVEVHFLLAGGEVFGQCFGLFHLALQVFFCQEHEQHLALHLWCELPVLACVEFVGEGRHQHGEPFVSESEEEQVGDGGDVCAVALGVGKEAEEAKLLCVAVLPSREEECACKVLLHHVLLSGDEVVPEGCVLSCPERCRPEQVEDVVLHFAGLFGCEQALPFGEDGVLCLCSVDVVQAAQCLAVVVVAEMEAYGAASLLGECDAVQLNLLLHMAAIGVVAAVA